MTDDQTADAQINAVLADRASSFWLKSALQTAVHRDPVDAAADAALLADLLQGRCDAVLAEACAQGRATAA